MWATPRPTLYAQVYSDEALTTAWQKVRSGSQTAGVDNITVEQFEARLFANLKTLQDALCTRRYYPQPVKRFYLPKPEGVPRPMGILTVSDRIVQRAVLDVLDPMFDRTFTACSHGFRKGRSAKTAIEQIRHLVQQDDVWLVDLDIERCFEHINLNGLYTLIKKTLKDRDLRRLVQAHLHIETVVVERTGRRQQITPRGILQGSPLSPLFANIYLDRFDKLAQQKGLRHIRYGDDIVICCRSKPEAETALKRAQKWLAKMGLTVHPHKTVIVHAEKGFSYLGERLVLKPHKGGRKRLEVLPPKLTPHPVPALSAAPDTGDDDGEAVIITPAIDLLAAHDE